MTSMSSTLQSLGKLSDSKFGDKKTTLALNAIMNTDAKFCSWTKFLIKYMFVLKSSYFIYNL